MTSTPVRFTDGTSRRVPAHIVESLAGIDTDGNLVASSDGMLYPLTPCCSASGKGSVNSPTGVCCRACYAELDPYFGSVLTASDVAVAVASRS